MHSSIKIAKHFVDKANEEGLNDMTLLKLMKITYIAHGWMLGVYRKRLITEDVEAWKYGPVIPELYRETKQFGRNHIQSLSDAFALELDTEEQSIIDQTYENYSSFTAGQLVSLTHKDGTPWQLTVDFNDKKTGAGVVIPGQLIEEYYAGLLGR